MKQIAFSLVLNFILGAGLFLAENIANAKEDPILIYGCSEIDPIATDSGYIVVIEQEVNTQPIASYTAVLFQQSVFGIQQIESFPVTLKKTETQDIFNGDGISLVISEPKIPESREYPAQLSLNRKFLEPLFRDLICGKE